MKGPALLKCLAFLEWLAKMADEPNLEDEQLVVLEIQKEVAPWSRDCLLLMSAEVVAVVADADPEPSESVSFGSFLCWGCG